MQRDAERRADVGGRFRVGERDRPGHVGRTPVAAPRHRDSPAAHGVSANAILLARSTSHVVHRGASSTARHVYRTRPPPAAMRPHVEHAARADDGEQLAGILPEADRESTRSSSSFAPTSAATMMAMPRSGVRFGSRPAALRARHHRKPEAEQVRGGQQHAVGCMNRDGARLEAVPDTRVSLRQAAGAPALAGRSRSTIRMATPTVIAASAS